MRPASAGPLQSITVRGLGFCLTFLGLRNSILEHQFAIVLANNCTYQSR